MPERKHYARLAFKEPFNTLKDSLNVTRAFGLLWVTPQTGPWPFFVAPTLSLFNPLLLMITHVLMCCSVAFAVLQSHPSPLP